MASATPPASSVSPAVVQLPGAAGPEAYRFGGQRGGAAPGRRPTRASTIPAPAPPARNPARIPLGPLGPPVHRQHVGTPAADLGHVELLTMVLRASARTITHTASGPHPADADSHPRPLSDLYAGAQFMVRGFPASLRALVATVVAATRKASAARLQTQWQQWLGSEVVRVVLAQFTHTATPDAPLVLSVEYDLATGRPLSSLPPTNTPVSRGTRPNRAALTIESDLTTTPPSIRTVKGVLPPEWTVFFTSLEGRPLQFPSAHTLQAGLGLTNAFTSRGLHLVAPMMVGSWAAVVDSEPTLTLSVAPEERLLTGFLWTWPDGRRVLGGIPWVGQPYVIRHEVVTTAQGTRVHVPLPLEQQPFQGTIDERALSVLAAEYCARWRRRLSGWGAPDGGEVRIHVFPV